MITRRTAVKATTSHFFRPSTLSLVLLACLIVLLIPLSSSASDVLHTATSVNDTAGANLAPACPATDLTASAATTAVPDFVPTDEWQTVLPGQAIPPGLWVRMDMTTGHKTARLLPKDDDDTAAQGEQLESAGLVIVPSADGDATGAVYEDDESVGNEPDNTPSESYSSEDSEIPVTVLSAKDETVAGTLGAAALDLPPSTFSNPTHAQLSALKAARAARLREIAEAFKPTDDLAIIKQLLSIIMMGGASSVSGDEAVGVDGVLQAMELLESLVHQVDNAADFVGLGGLDMILQVLDASSFQRSLPSSLIANQHNKDTSAGEEVSAQEQMRRLAALQESAAWLLGTAAQNNPTVKREAMKEQTIFILLSLLDHTQTELQRLEQSAVQAGGDGDMRDAWRRVQAKTLYALSSLLRSFPDAQNEFYQRQGSDRLLSLLTSTAPSVSPLDKQQRVVYGKTLALLSDMVQDRLINDVNASSSALFDQLTDEQWCGVFANATQHTTALLHHAASPSVSLSSSLSALKTADVALGIVKLLAEHELCRSTFTASQPLQAHIQQQAADVSRAAAALTAEDDSHRYYYAAMHNKLQAITAALSAPSSSPSPSSPATPVNDTATATGLSLLGTPLMPCSSSPLTGFHRDAHCRHDPRDGGRHLVCALLTDQFLQYSQQQGNDLITPRGGFPGLHAGDKWCLCVGRWKEALQAGVAPGVLLEATNARAEDGVSRQALLAHAVVDGPAVAS